MADCAVSNFWRPANGFASWLPAAGAAVVSPASVDRAEWDFRMADYLRLDGLYRAAVEFGPYGKADENAANMIANLQMKYGINFRLYPEAKEQAEKAYRDRQRVEDAVFEQYLVPLLKAQRLLVVTPAPDLAAALFKIELIREENLHDDPDLTKDCFTLVEQDMARLQQGGRA